MKCEATTTAGNSCHFSAKYYINGRYTCGNHTPKNDRTDSNLIGNTNATVAQEDFFSKCNSYACNNDDNNLDRPVATSNAKLRPRVPCTLVLSGVILNSAPCIIQHLGLTFRSAEDAFEASIYYYEHKSPAINHRLCQYVGVIVAGNVTASDFGREWLPIRPDWNIVKERFLFDILENKFTFASMEARGALFETGTAELASHDNITAKVLMLVRTSIFDR